jgi:3-oxoacyl-[acyl-carrier-protein] synthase-3
MGDPVTIAGTGSFAPARTLTNEELSRMVETTDEWITQRTGIRERRIAAPEETPATMGAEAARRALEAAGVAGEDVQLIVCGTSMGDYFAPCTSALIQKALGARRAGIFDVNAGCTGFVCALATAWRFVASGAADPVLVLGTEALSRGVNYKDRATCIIFGDGAGAVVLRRGGPGEFLHSELGGDGWQSDAIIVPGGGAALPPAACTDANRSQYYLHMEGRDIYVFAVRKFVDLTRNALAAAGASIDKLALLVPHQVNLRIIESACERLGLPLERVGVNIQKYGNTSAASVPLALDECVRAGRLKRGDLTLLIGFGAGLTWGSVLLRY